MTANLRDVLTEYPPAMLGAIADGWRISLTDEQLPEIIARLVTEMTRPENFESVLRRLSDHEKAALAFLAAHEQVRAHIFTRRYGQVRRMGPGRLEWEAAWREPVSVAERLWFLGLIYRTFAVDGEYHGEVFAVPVDLRSLLPAMEAALPRFEVQVVAEPSCVEDERDALARDLFAVLAHLRNNDVRSKKGVLARHEFDRLRHRLARTDHARLQFLWRLAQQAELVQWADQLWMPAQQAAPWLKRDALSRQRLLFETWLADAGWNELCAMPSVRCEDTGWRHDPVLPRRALRRHLDACPANVWLALDSLVDAVYDTDPDFMRPDGDYQSWYIRGVEDGRYLLGFDSWGKLEGALIRYLLEHALFWLGVIALGKAQEAEPATAIRVSATGSALLSGEGAPTGVADAARREEAAARIVLSSDLSILVPGAASWYDRFLVERFARWVEDTRGGARYVMDAPSLKRALSRGVAVPQIENFLARVSGGRVPAKVQRALKSWGGSSA